MGEHEQTALLPELRVRVTYDPVGATFSACIEGQPGIGGQATSVRAAVRDLGLELRRFARDYGAAGGGTPISQAVAAALALELDDLERYLLARSLEPVLEAGADLRHPD